MNGLEELAEQAGFSLTHSGLVKLWLANSKDIEAFAKLVAAKEREAIWNILFDYAGRDDLTLEDESLLKHLADLISARS